VRSWSSLFQSLIICSTFFPTISDGSLGACDATGVIAVVVGPVLLAWTAEEVAWLVLVMVVEVLAATVETPVENTRLT
jgi:hypothetical protein